jgi:hypothetical protein
VLLAVSLLSLPMTSRLCACVCVCVLSPRRRSDSRALPERCGRDALRHINAECSCTALVVSAPDDGSSEDVSGVCADKLLPVLQSLLRSP